MTTTRLIELKPEHLAQVQEVLRRHLLGEYPEARVWVFGSRATGRNHPRSDIDLAIELGGDKCGSLGGDEGTCAGSDQCASAGGVERLPDAVLDALKRGFHDSDLPQRVDVVDIARLKDDAFRRNLLRDRLPLPLGG